MDAGNPRLPGFRAEAVVVLKLKSELGLRLHAWAALLCACLLLTAAGAGAAPVAHSIVDRFVNIDVRLAGVVSGSSSGVALTGDRIGVDATPLTIETIRTETPPTPIFLSQPLGGPDPISVETESLERTPSIATTASADIHRPVDTNQGDPWQCATTNRC